MRDVEFDIRRQTEAARNLIASIREAGADDDLELVSDAIEGETTLHEAISVALDEIDLAEALQIGLRAKMDDFETREFAIGKRADRLRALIEQAMVSAEQTQMKLPTATLSITKRAPGLVIQNEADIPARFWMQPAPPAPRIDRKALREALAANEPVAGAMLDNGSISLTIRRR